MKLTKFSKLRVAGVLPLAAGMMMLFSFTTRQPEIIAVPQAAPETALEIAPETVAEVVAEIAPEVQKPETQKPQAQAPMADDDVALFSVDKMPTFEGGDINTFRSWMLGQVRYPKEAMENKIQGKVTSKFIIERDGSVSNVEVMVSPHKLLSDEAMRVIASSPKWTPGEQKGKPARVYYVIPIEFKLDDDAPAGTTDAGGTAAAETHTIKEPIIFTTKSGGESYALSPDALLFVDGREVPLKMIENIPPDEIASIQILTETAAIAPYGERAQNGVVLVDTKKPKRTKERLNAGYGSVAKDANTTAISQLDMKNAHGYTSLKDYIQGRVAGVHFNGNSPVIRGIATINSGTEPLVVVDGTPVNSFADANTMLMPNEVESISVLKDSAASIYGVRGANGVILITTKKSNEK